MRRFAEITNVKKRMFANGTLVKSDEVHDEIAFSFSGFSCEEKFILPGIKSLYYIIPGMPRLVKYQPWIDWRTRTVASSTQYTAKDALTIG